MNLDTSKMQFQVFVPQWQSREEEKETISPLIVFFCFFLSDIIYNWVWDLWKITSRNPRNPCCGNPPTPHAPNTTSPLPLSKCQTALSSEFCQSEERTSALAKQTCGDCDRKGRRNGVKTLLVVLSGSLTPACRCTVSASVLKVADSVFGNCSAWACLRGFRHVVGHPPPPAPRPPSPFLKDVSIVPYVCRFLSFAACGKTQNTSVGEIMRLWLLRRALKDLQCVCVWPPAPTPPPPSLRH